MDRTLKQTWRNLMEVKMSLQLRYHSQLLQKELQFTSTTTSLHHIHVQLKRYTHSTKSDRKFIMSQQYNEKQCRQCGRQHHLNQND